MKILEKICLFFTILGAFNWGLVGLFKFNLVTFIFKPDSIITNIIYSVIGLCGIISISTLIKKTSD